MKAVSVWTYYFNNKRRVLPVVLIIALSVLGVTAAAALTGAINQDIISQTSIYSHFYVIQLDDQSTTTLDQLKLVINDQQLADSVVTGSRRGVSMPSVIGVSSAFVFFLPPGQTEKFMKPLQWKITKGHAPQQVDEIVLTTPFLRAKHLQIGDTIGQEVDSTELLPGKYTIVGSITTPEPYNAGITLTDQLTPADTLFITPLPGQEDKLDMELQSLADQFKATAETHSSVQADLATEFSTLDTVLWAINSITILVITLSVGLINIIFFMQRANEFGLLAALGYSRGFIIRKTLLESFGMVVVGWTLGLLLAEITYQILNRLLFANATFGLTVFNLRIVLFSVPVPIAVILFSTITVLWKLLRLDPISIIEKRD